MTPDGPLPERISLHLARLINESPLAKRLQHKFFLSVNMRLVGLCMHNVLHVEGLDIASTLAPSRGVLLCANHRSFFDQYILTQLLLEHASWLREVYFPVRSSFVYDTWAGMLINALAAGMAMYPPIYRDPQRAPRNLRSLDQVAEWLKRPGVLVGMHPEGTRSKDPDPYKLLPAQPGVGKLIARARPVVLPAFINGASNHLIEQIRNNYSRSKRQPVIVVFGPPVDLEGLLDEHPRPALYLRIARRVRDEIRGLGERERTLRGTLLQSPSR